MNKNFKNSELVTDFVEACKTGLPFVIGAGIPYDQRGSSYITLHYAQCMNFNEPEAIMAGRAIFRRCFQKTLVSYAHQNQLMIDGEPNLGKTVNFTIEERHELFPIVYRDGTVQQARMYQFGDNAGDFIGAKLPTGEVVKTYSHTALRSVANDNILIGSTPIFNPDKNKTTEDTTTPAPFAASIDASFEQD